MRISIFGLLAIVIGLTVCTGAQAQDPVTYDPNYYENDYFNPNNPMSPRARQLRALRAKQHAGVMAKVENFASGVKSGVVSGVTTMTASAAGVVNYLSALNDPNNSLPHVSSGPGSPLQQPGSLTGTAADLRSPTPPAAPLFTTPTTSKSTLFPNLFGPPTAAATGLGLGKQP
jgi:hypothetical protein